MPINPEDYGAVKKAAVSPESYGATKISASEFGGSGIITPDESSGMVQPSPEQLKQRDLLGKFQAVDRGELKFSDLTPAEQKQMDFYNDKGGGTFLQRMGEGIKMTPEGKAGFIAATTNKEKPPIRGENGKVYTYDSKTGQYQPFNPPGLDIGDVGQAIGENIGLPVNLGAAAFPGGTSAPVQAVAGAGNALVKQGASAILPGQDNMSIGDRVKDVGTNALVSGAIQGAWNAILGFGKFITPTQYIARKYNQASVEAVAQTGATLKADIGKKLGKEVFMDVAQETQDPWLNGLKAVAEQSFEGKKAARDSFNNQVGDALRYSSIVVDDITRGSSMSPQAFGDQVKTTFRKAVDNAYNARSSMARADYALFDGNKATAPITDFWKEVQSAVQDYAPLHSTLTKGLKIGGKIVKEGDDMMTISQMVDIRRALADISRGNGKMFEGLDSNIEKKIANRLLNGKDPSQGVSGINSDLQKAGDWIGDPTLKSQLDKANRNYATNSEFIRTLEYNVLGKALRGKEGTYKAGEDVSKMLMSLTNGPTSNVGKLRAVFDLAEFQANPAVAAGLREQFVRGLITQGERGAGNAPAGVEKFDPQALYKAFVRKDKDTFQYIFKDPAERQAVQNIVDFNQRIGSVVNMKGGLNPVQESGEVAALAGGTLSGNLSSGLIFGPKFVAKWYLGKTASKMVFDRQGQQALKTLAKADPTTKAWTSALSYTVERTMAEPSEEKVAEQLPEMQQ
jgi:hypothetical protein